MWSFFSSKWKAKSILQVKAISSIKYCTKMLHLIVIDDIIAVLA